MAAQHAGVEPVWASEIEPFPAAVTAYHFSEVVQLGDITKLDGAKLPPVDIVTAGSPCQDLSVAGKREGLDGARSGLFRTAIRLVRDMRNKSDGRYPRYFVWENVPGAFSSNKGNDFRAVLEEIGEAEIPLPEHGRWTSAGMVDLPHCQIAWRTFDAQYWGVPQRRKRIFLVADFGGRSAGEILFEQQGLYGYFTQSRKAREGTAAGTESGIGGASGDCLTPWDVESKRITAESGVSPTLAGSDGGGGRNPAGLVFAAGFKAGQSKAGNIGYEVERAATLGANMSGTEPTVAVYEFHGQDTRLKGPLQVSPAIAANAGMGGNNLPLVHSYAIAGNVIGREDKNGGHHMGVDKDVSFTLNTADRHAVYAMQRSDEWKESQVSHTLAARDYKDATDLVAGKSVRRLTPTECERLQGLPDGYTDVPCNGKPASDTQRYKALGNAMAQPCADYVIRRIVEVCNGEV